MVIVQEADFDTATLTAQLRAQAGAAAGALVIFTGYVRDYSENMSTQTLFLDYYPGMCEREIEAICATARTRWNIAGHLVVHRAGALRHQEQIVFVGVASAHRSEAFSACEYIIDALKTRAPFWKRETLASGESFWVQQRDADAHKSAQWDNRVPPRETS